MRTAFLALALATISALTASALDGTEFVERNGPQFLFAWPDDQRDAAVDALEGLARSPYMRRDDPSFADHERRRQRIIAKSLAGMPFYDQEWHLIQPFSLLAPDGSTWGIYQMSLPETIMLGVATGWYLCDPTQQDTDDDQAAQSHCDDMRNRALALNEQITSSRHMTPGGQP